ncbi:beta-propeller domain-containing protein [Oceanobacillus halophilus]|uniref:SbsA Ig-like domain-containing protein n=1 Tax=Oceanobacillus halophilus TaxID=930130 RepID=A0A494ZZZ7_9BACI|nr:beta-propeller domain-containing protein [Oceanobacillus halophilus]RKQ32605.1 hypothetical protein D8M06_11745 [Oceanobacillus halophilus]
MARYRWIIVLGIIGVLATSVFFMFFSQNITAEIPAPSKYALTTKDWSIQFSESMNPDSFTQGTVTIVNENDQPADISYEWNDLKTVLTLRAPSNGYREKESYTIKISDEVQTESGKPLSKSLVHSFIALAELPNIEDNEQLVDLLKERTEEKKRLFEAFEMEESTTVSDNTSSSADNAPVSETNIQVAEVDEGDVIKTNGKHIYFVRDNDIVISSAKNEHSEVISTISTKNFQPREIYLNDQLLIAIGLSFVPIHEKPTENDSDESADIAIHPTPTEQTTVQIYDISNVNKPEKNREIVIEGYLNSSRLMDGYLYLIANQYPKYRILEERGDHMDMRPMVKDSAVSDEAIPIPFEDMYYFPESQEANYLSLASIDLNNLEEQVNIQSYLGASNEMYMSKNHIYLAQRKYETIKSYDSKETMIARLDQANTEIFQFQVDSGDITYKTSTDVQGTLINQFAMDERNNTFRVATTKGTSWQDDQASTNNLYTFDIDLNPLGSVEDLAKGEQIFSVRFMEDIAYMVTFKQVDPLFVIDLKNPKKPEVLGELKIPGFSNYLHPLDEDHVIGIGQNTKLEENEHSKEPQVRIDGLKVSLFDVSDPTKPIEKDNEILGSGSSHSEVTYNHHVLYKHPEQNLFGFPAVLYETKMVQQGEAAYETDSFVYEGAFLFTITPEEGIKLSNSLTHQDPNQQLDYPENQSQIKRMVSSGNNLYTFSHDKFKVYDMQQQKVIHTVELPEQTNYPMN